MSLPIAAVLSVCLSASAQAEMLVTPSGNIVCFVVEDAGEYGNYIACEVRKRSNATLLQPRPSDCPEDMDWGSSFSIAEISKAELNCHHGGTIPAADAKRLSYGDQFEFHGITCDSETAGLTCRNKDGHGFFVSRARQELF